MSIDLYTETTFDHLTNFLKIIQKKITAGCFYNWEKVMTLFHTIYRWQTSDVHLCLIVLGNFFMWLSLSDFQKKVDVKLCETFLNYQDIWPKKFRPLEEFTGNFLLNL